MRGVKVIVVTGGIASGKSTVVEMLQEMGGAGVELYDCDAAVAELQQSGKLSRDLVTAFGTEALCDDGSVNKDYLRGIVQNDPEGRDKLNNLIHPKLAQMCLDAQAEARRREHELRRRGTPEPFEKVLAEMQQRDYNDSHRAAAPLRQAEDAVLLDTTELDFQQSEEALLKIIEEKTVL